MDAVVLAGKAGSQDRKSPLNEGLGDSLVSANLRQTTEIAFTFRPAPNALTTFELLSFFCSD